MSKLKETEVAEAVIAFMEERGWDVFQEVKLHSGGSIADIAGVRGDHIWLVETKTTLNLDVIGQAISWQRYVHWVSVGVPSAKRSSKGRDIAWSILKEHGIGLLTVEQTWGNTLKVDERTEPRLWRHRNRPKKWYSVTNREPPSPEKIRRGYLERIQEFRGNLSPEHKTFAKAGSKGKHWSPWQNTMREVVRYVHKNPGCHLKALVDTVGKMHYASIQSAKSSISYWVQAGRVDGVRCEREGRFLKLYPVPEVNSE